MRTAAEPVSRLDEILPNYHVHTVHATDVHGSVAEVFAAVKAVTAQDVFLFRALMAVRALPARLRGKASLRLTAGTPLVEQLLTGGFLLLAEVPDRELVIGSIGQFWKLSEGTSPRVTTADEFRAFAQPGYAKAAVNFLVVSREAGVRLSTETRVYATDPGARRKFTAYWRVIHPGSALIRRMWLRAVRRHVASWTARSYVGGLGGPP